MEKNSDTVTQVMDSFRRIVQALRTSHRAAENVDLTGAQLFVLSILGSAANPLGVRELAERTRTDQSTVSVVVGRLVERGLVKRVRSSVDTRRVELSLTPRGRTLQRKMPTTIAQQHLAEALAQLSSSDAATLNRLLAGIVSNMGVADTEAPMLFDDTHPPPAKGTSARRPRRNPSS